MDLDAGLRGLGFSSFRPGQREAIETLLDAGRLLLVAPTGGGKSLTYQLPASLLPGTTIVVSPLISLMHDQVAALERRGVRSTYFASTLDAGELGRRVADAARGAFKLIYVAPERLSHGSFRGLLPRLRCPLVAVDEAHCISEWGHDFRPDYMQIGEVLAQAPGAKVLACTATATPIVRDEILERLGLPADTAQLVRGFARPNLALRVVDVRSAAEARERVDATLRECLRAPRSGVGTAILYAPTRKRAEEEAERLTAASWRCAAYHAGMDGEARDRAQNAFIHGGIELVVATNAFGMGIDRPDVRCVIHLAPPGSVEAYYQEAGRAGRDGKDAVCTLLTSAGDLPLRRHLIESDVDGRAPDPETVRHKWNLFLELMRWAEGGSCRHDAILRYFGDEEETLSGCGRCDVCTTLSRAEDAPEDVSTLVRKALCGVARVHGRFGLTAAVKLLRGEEDERLDWSGLKHTPTFGILKDHSEDWLTKLLRRCVTAGWVDFTGGMRPVVVVTEEGADVIHERRPARLLLPPERPHGAPFDRLRAGSATGHGAKAAAPSARKGGPQTREALEDLDADGRRLFEALRSWRIDTARGEHVPAYVVASDRTLRDIALLRPATIDELKLAHGIGPAKAERYGEALLAIVKGGGERGGG